MVVRRPTQQNGRWNAHALAESIRQRLASTDWYADMTNGDEVIWYDILSSLQSDAPAIQLGIGFQSENDGYLYWDTAKLAASLGANMMAGRTFGQSGFRYSGKSKSPIEFMYSLFLPVQTQLLLNQLRVIAPHFEALPDEKSQMADEFLEGLLEPVESIVDSGRVMWVQMDT
ncbi:MAG: hypothetical protein QM813_27445 [Verrucomicrobiota bacterium]